MSYSITADFDAPIQNVRATTNPVAKTGAVIYAGSLVQIADATGLAQGYDPDDGGKIVGRCGKALMGTEPAGTMVEVQEGDIFLAVDGTATPTVTNNGKHVYASDANTVRTTNTLPVAGIQLGLATSPLGVSGVMVRCTVESCFAPTGA
jgi:hypothetical protein